MKRIPTRISAIERVIPPPWLPVDLHPAWRRLSDDMKSLLSGRGGSVASIRAVLEALPDDRRTQVLQLIRTRLDG